MATASVIERVSVEDFLAKYVSQRCEYVDGAVIEKPMGDNHHGWVQTVIGTYLFLYFKEHGTGYAAAEVHCRVQINGKDRYRLPDVLAMRGPLGPRGLLDRAPDLAIEVKSDDNTVTQLLRKLSDYFANGTQLAWIFVPEDRAILVATPNGPIQVLLAGETLTGGTLLSGFSVPVADLFPPAGPTD